jgi:hypothetical protein
MRLPREGHWLSSHVRPSFTGRILPEISRPSRHVSSMISLIPW